VLRLGCVSRKEAVRDGTSIRLRSIGLADPTGVPGPMFISGTTWRQVAAVNATPARRYGTPPAGALSASGRDSDIEFLWFSLLPD
jgi:hypothetical protein